MDSRLFQAAKIGDINELHAILEEDPLALQKVALLPYVDTPLHIATLAGKTNFVKELLQEMPEFAADCNRDGLSPLHIASGLGYVDIVSEILKVSPDLGLIKDKEGRTPLHYATIKGRVNVVDELVSQCPQVAWEVTANGETALHLAVLYSQFEAFKMLIAKLSSSDLFELINVADDYGNTVLLLAESMKQLQVLNTLKDHGIPNIHHIMEEFQDQAHHQDLNNTSPLSIYIQTHHHDRDAKETITFPQAKETQSPLPSTAQDQQSILEQQSKSLRRMVISKGVVPILAGILATSAYRQGLTPPPNVWNEKMRLDSSCFLNTFRNFSLTKSIDQCPPGTYYLFMSFNSAAFYCSIFLVFLHHVPGFLHALLPASLVSSLFSYLVFLLSMFPDAPTFLIINSMAFLVFGLVIILKVVGKYVTNWTLKLMKKSN